MASGNFPNCLSVTLAYEGGWADNPKDPGGATMKGITLATYRRYFPKATKADLRAISDHNVRQIYSDDYWTPVNGDGLAKGVDLATFDAAVNSGVSRAERWLKASVGGPDADTVKKICAKRMGFLHALKTWAAFGKGWTARVAAIEAKGVAWALAATAISKTEVTSKLKKEASAASSAASKQVGGAATSAGGAIVGPTQIDFTHLTTSTTLIIGALVVLAVVGVFVLARSAHVNATRAAAYNAEAAKQ